MILVLGKSALSVPDTRFINHILDRVEGMDEARTQMLEENRLLLTKKQTNRNYPVGGKQTGWLAGKAGLDKARQGRTRLDWTGQDKAGLDRAGQGWKQTTSNIW